MKRIAPSLSLSLFFSQRPIPYRFDSTSGIDRVRGGLIVTVTDLSLSLSSSSSFFASRSVLSLAGLPFSQDYPLTQLEEGFAIDAGPSLVRRRINVAQRQFSLFHDAETKDVYIQLHSAVAFICGL